jgi:hypothetical protein
VKASNSGTRKPYERPTLRKPTPEQATLFLVGHAYIGNQGAKELLELVVLKRTDSASQPNRSECFENTSSREQDLSVGTTRRNGK